MRHQQGEDGIPHAEELQIGKEPTQIRILRCYAMLRWIGDGLALFLFWPVFSWFKAV
jgi:hypothetical protein